MHSPPNGGTDLLSDQAPGVPPAPGSQLAGTAAFAESTALRLSSGPSAFPVTDGGEDYLFAVQQDLADWRRVARAAPGIVRAQGEKRGKSWATPAEPQPTGTLPNSTGQTAPEGRRAIRGGPCKCCRPLTGAERRLSNSWHRQRSRGAKASRPSTDRTAGLRFPDGSAAGFRRMATEWLQKLGPGERVSAARF